MKPAKDAGNSYSHSNLAIESLGDDTPFKLVGPILHGCDAPTLLRLESTSSVCIPIPTNPALVFRLKLFPVPTGSDRRWEPTHFRFWTRLIPIPQVYWKDLCLKRFPLESEKCQENDEIDDWRETFWVMVLGLFLRKCFSSRITAIQG